MTSAPIDQIVFVSPSSGGELGLNDAIIHQLGAKQIRKNKKNLGAIPTNNFLLEIHERLFQVIKTDRLGNDDLRVIRVAQNIRMVIIYVIDKSRATGDQERLVSELVKRAPEATILLISNDIKSKAIEAVGCPIPESKKRILNPTSPDFIEQIKLLISQV